MLVGPSLPASSSICVREDTPITPSLHKGCSRPTPWSPEAQAPRRRELCAYIRAVFRPLLDDQGRSTRLLWWDQSRIAVWSTHAFFLGSAEEAADF